MDNPYRPGTIKYQILNGDWIGMDSSEIAEKIGCPVKTARHAIYELKKEIGFKVKKIDQRLTKRRKSKNGNIYRENSKLWKMYEGYWKDNTIPEIAKEIGASEKTVRNYISKIQIETGKYIDYVDGRTARRMRSGKRMEEKDCE